MKRLFFYAAIFCLVQSNLLGSLDGGDIDLKAGLRKAVEALEVEDLKTFASEPDHVGAAMAIEASRDGKHAAWAGAQLYLQHDAADLELAWWKSEKREVRLVVMTFLILLEHPERYEFKIKRLAAGSSRFATKEAAARKAEIQVVSSSLDEMAKLLLLKMEAGELEGGRLIRRLRFYARSARLEDNRERRSGQSEQENARPANK